MAGSEWTGYNETSQGQTALTYPAMGLVFGLAFLVAPFGVRFATRRAAGDQLYHNGTELTLVSTGGRGPTVFDLTRTRTRVRLALRRDPGNIEFIIDLTNPRTRHMRSDREIPMREGTMRFAPDPATRLAAGQLRTVARWTRLPVIYETSPDAVPASPDGTGSAPTPRTPVVRGVPAPEIDVVGPDVVWSGVTGVSRWSPRKCRDRLWIRRSSGNLRAAPLFGGVVGLIGRMLTTRIGTLQV